MIARVLGTGLVILALASCLDSGLVTCDELQCPAGTRCTPAGTCALAEQVAACDGKVDGDACTYTGTDDGVCAGGVCVAAACGNGVLEDGEACDDGNAVPGDGCAGDCRSDESCGNGIPDFGVGEACDCGKDAPRDGCAFPNSDEPGAECRPDCTPGRCGDGVLEEPEECEGSEVGAASCTDFGFYEGDLGCSASCRFDRSACSGRCGDGELNGAELCEGDIVDGPGCLAYGFGMGTVRCQGCGYLFSSCTQIGWDRQSMQPRGPISAWGSAADDLWLVEFNGETGATWHFDGTAWTTTTAGVVGFTGYKAVWGTAADDVFVLTGFTGLGVSHFDGAAWSTAAVPVGTSFVAGWSPGADEVVLAGNPGLARRSGGTWTLEDVGTTMRSVWGTSATNVWGVGDGGRIRHWDGTAWAVRDGDLATTVDWRVVTGSGSDDVWLGGADGTLAHWDGAAWTTRATTFGPSSLSVRGPHDVLFVGGTTVAAYDGSLVRIVELPGSPSSSQLLDLDGTRIAAASQEIYRATGAFWTRATTDFIDDLKLIDGDVWTVSSAHGGVKRNLEPVAGAPGYAFYAIDGVARDDVWAAAYNEHPAPEHLWHWDGATWTASVAVDMVIQDLHARAADDVWAVGIGGAWHWDGATWTNTGLDASSVWAVGPDDVWAADQVISHWDGVAWTEVTADLPPLVIADNLYTWAVWAAAANDVYAAGPEGIVLHFDGATWAQLAAGLGSEDAYVAGGQGADDVFVPTFNAMLHWDGFGWSRVRMPSSAGYKFGLVVTPDRVLLAGNGLYGLVR